MRWGVILLVAFTLAGIWHPRWLPRWVTQVLAVGVAAPIATLAVYLLKVNGDLSEFFNSEARVSGFFFLTGSSLFIGLLLALGALYRERDQQGHADKHATPQQLNKRSKKNRIEQQGDCDSSTDATIPQMRPAWIDPRLE